MKKGGDGGMSLLNCDLWKVRERHAVDTGQEPGRFRLRVHETEK